MRFNNKILSFLGFGFLLVFLQGCYVLKGAYYQGRVLLSREKVEDILRDPSQPEKLKSRLLLVKRILNFAKEEGLNVDGAYSTVVKNNREAVSYLVEAAEPLELKQQTWWFPIVGSVPYRGYFVESDRDDMARELEAKGLDVHKASASGFSSLGWFDDPIYESMLKDKEYFLANLLFHELTHRTLWISGSVSFNENLATFVGDRLTVNYLKSYKLLGDLEEYERFKQDRLLFKEWVKALKGALEDLYDHGKKEGVPIAELKEHKNALIQEYVLVKKPKFSMNDYVGRRPWNNARILGENLYLPDLDLFERAFVCLQASSLGGFLKKISSMIDKTDPADPFELVTHICHR